MCSNIIVFFLWYSRNVSACPMAFFISSFKISRIFSSIRLSFPLMRLTPPRRARRLTAAFVIPWMLSLSTLRCRFAPPLACCGRLARFAARLSAAFFALRRFCSAVSFCLGSFLGFAGAGSAAAKAASEAASSSASGNTGFASTYLPNLSFSFCTSFQMSASLRLLEVVPSLSVIFFLCRKQIQDTAACWFFFAAVCAQSQNFFFDHICFGSFKFFFFLLR